MPNLINWSQINTGKINSFSPRLGNIRPCPICGSSDARPFMELNNFQFYSDSSHVPKLFTVRNVQCLDCSTLFMNPCYSKYGFSVLFDEAARSYGSLLEHTEDQIQWLTAHSLLENGIRILDVGCFEADFLSALPENIKKIGVDIDKKAIERGLNKIHDQNIKLFAGDLSSFSMIDEIPDTITMFHVLEHLPYPLEVLKSLHAISDKSTKLIIEVPIIENGNTNNIHGFFSIQHTTHFSKNSLSDCLRNSGWETTFTYEVEKYNGYRVIARKSHLHKQETNFIEKQSDWINLNSSLLSWRSAIAATEKTIQLLPSFENYIIWGGGAHTEYLYQLTSLFHLRRESRFIIVDSDPVKLGKSWRGINIHSPQVLSKVNWENTALIISSYASQESIADFIYKKNLPRENIFKLYDVIKRY